MGLRTRTRCHSQMANKMASTAEPGTSTNGTIAGTTILLERPRITALAALTHKRR